MARYIDADEAMQIINNYAKAIDYDCDNCKVVIDAIKDIVSVICPTADVVEVKYGEWKHKLDCNGYGCYECSKCNTLHEYDTEYCPNCGAKMDVRYTE